MRVVHLMASPFYGGPERQVLGLARHLPGDVQSSFLSFPERGLATAFLDEARKLGFDARALHHNVPRLIACVREVADELRRVRADLLCTSGYKPDVIGWRAARRVGIPVVSISHGWTGATWKVRCYEQVDRWILRWFDVVVCVSKAQADKVRAIGVPEAKIVVIQNAVGAEAFLGPDPEGRAEMTAWFAQPPRLIVGAAGRLSPEKGFAILIESAAMILKQRAAVGFVLFGEGPLRADLERRVAQCGLQGRFVFAGFRADLNRYLPGLDVHAMSSYTEGLPVILLETTAAGVPSVATTVGGIPEVIDDGQTGYLVPPGDPVALAQRILTLLDSESQRHAMGRAGRDRVRRHFSFAAMSARYHELFKRLVERRS
jgi:glycosyltransferase involved in cell wall biosynthesis